MALTRSSLKAMGIEVDKIDEIINGHTESLNAIKDERNQLKEQLADYERVKADLTNARHDLDEAKKDSWKVKYDALREEFDGFKTETAAKETRAQKESLYTALLKETGVSEKRIPAILKVTNLDSVQLENGAIKGADELKQGILSEWSDFITTSGVQGAGTPNPPDLGGSKNPDELSDAEFYKAVEESKK